MMKLYGSIKILFKSIKSTFLINLAYFLILPLGLAFFMGMIEEKLYENPIKTDPVPITIVDNDKSTYSAYFKDFCKNNLSEIVKIEKNRDNSDLQVTIPKGYEKHILNKTQTNIEIKELSSINSTALIQNLFDNYHESIYLSSIENNLNKDNIEEIFNKSSLNTQLIDSNIKQNSYEFFAITMLGFLAIIFITNNVSANYLSDSNGFVKRNYSMPIGRIELLMHDIVTSTIYSFTFILLYAVFFRFLKISFTGNIVILISMIFAISLLISSFTLFLYNFFNKAIGQGIAYALMMAQVLFGGMLSGFSDFLDKFSNLNPCYIVTEMFTNYKVYNTFSSVSNYFYLCLIISLILIVITSLKVKYSWREI